MVHIAPLPGSLARQPCLAALPGSLARQPCPAALARQPCPAALQKYYSVQIDIAFWTRVRNESEVIFSLVINDFYFLEDFLEDFFFGVLHQAVRAVSKNRPKYPMLDIPFTRRSIE
jgi:hypothetical protein